MSTKQPWAYIACRDGYWAGLISASLGPDTSKAQEEAWKKTVAKGCGQWIADGWEIKTVYSREEYAEVLATLTMYDAAKHAAQPSML